MGHIKHFQVQFCIRKRTNILNIVIDEINPSIRNAKYYVHRELNWNTAELDWDVSWDINNLYIISVVIFQELSADIRSDPNY